MCLRLASLCLALCGLFSTTTNVSESLASNREDVSASIDIKEIMRLTMTQGLCQKVIKNRATPEEQRQLVNLLTQLEELTPPKGDISHWRKTTHDLSRAATEVAAGKPSHKALRKAANCVSCHREHRPR